MKKLLPGLIAVLFLVGCAGKTPNPIPLYGPNDNQLSCKSIKDEIYLNQSEATRLYSKYNKTGKNVALGVVGAVIFWPALLFMDFSDAEKIEMEAFQKRNAHLNQLLHDKHCK